MQQYHGGDEGEHGIGEALGGRGPTNESALLVSVDLYCHRFKNWF